MCILDTLVNGEILEVDLQDPIEPGSYSREAADILRSTEIGTVSFTDGIDRIGHNHRPSVIVWSLPGDQLLTETYPSDGSPSTHVVTDTGANDEELVAAIVSTVTDIHARRTLVAA